MECLSPFAPIKLMSLVQHYVMRRSDEIKFISNKSRAQMNECKKKCYSPSGFIFLRMEKFTLFF